MGIQGSILRDDVPPFKKWFGVSPSNGYGFAKCLKKKEEILNGDLKILIGTLNDTITLNCGHGQSIHILDASYGNPSIDHFLIKKDSLDAPHTLPIVQMMCEGKENCDVYNKNRSNLAVHGNLTTSDRQLLKGFCLHVNNETFKILSLIKDFHKLAIKYYCTPFKLPPFPPYKVKAKRGDDQTWSVEFQGEEQNKELYLHVNEINATCENPLLKRKYVDINEAEYECNNLSNCVYIIFNNDGYTLCESSSYKNATIRKNAKIYIKMSYIEGSIPNKYEVLPNVQGVCEGNDVIYEMDAALSLDEIYDKCAETRCDYFTLSTANGLEDYPCFQSKG